MKNIIYIVGLVTVLSYTNKFLQDNVNTMAQRAKCKVQINVSYAEKAKCSLVSVLEAIDSGL